MPEYSESPHWGQVWEQFMQNPFTDPMYTGYATGQQDPEDFAYNIDPKLTRYKDWQSKLNLPSFENLAGDFASIGEQFGLDVRDLQSQFGTQVGQFKQELTPELGQYTGLSMSPAAGKKRRKTIQDLYQDAIGARELEMETLQSGASADLLGAVKDEEEMIATLIDAFISEDPELKGPFDDWTFTGGGEEGLEMEPWSPVSEAAMEEMFDFSGLDDIDPSTFDWDMLLEGGYVTQEQYDNAVAQGWVV